MPAEESCARKFCRGIRRCTATEAPAYDHDRQIQKSSGGIRMLEFCVKQNVFLYAMIAAGIAGVWCLFWNNRFYTRGHPRSRKAEGTKVEMDQVGAGNVSEKSASLFECRGVYAQPDCTGQVSGNGSPDASARKPEYDPHGSGAVDSFAVGDLPIPLWRGGADALPRNGHRARRRPCLFPALSGFRRKRGNSAERLDRLSGK